MFFDRKGWIECVGCADRSAYDLTQHTKATGVRLVAEKKLPEPRNVDVVEMFPNKTVIGRTFKKDSKIVVDKLLSLGVERVEDIEKVLESGRYVFTK